MSKHQQRRERRAQYYQMLDGELGQERHFVRRVIRTLDHSGSDIAPDGRPIMADFWRFMRERKKTAPNSSLACLDLVEKATNSIAVIPISKRTTSSGFYA